MKIFSTFDTKLKEETLSLEIEKHGKETVYLLQRSKIFIWIKVILPIMQGLLFTAIIAISFGYFSSNNHSIVYIGTAIGSILSILFYNNALNGYIDYTMDYCIITPDEIILTEQKGFLSRIVRTLDVAKIKSINTDKHSLIHSIFNLGKIIFMSDGDEEQLGEIVFDYISDPEGQKKVIQHIIFENVYRRQQHNN